MGAALCPLRRKNWTEIKIGQHLRFREDRAWLAFESDDLKSSTRPLEFELPTEYVPRLQRYLIHYRPLFLSNRSLDSGALWLSWSGDPLSAAALAISVRQAIGNRLGIPFGFHNFRHVCATFIEQSAPDRALMAAGVLHHADFRMTQMHYIRGQRTAALRKYQSLVRKLVRSGRVEEVKRTKRSLAPR